MRRSWLLFFCLLPFSVFALTAEPPLADKAQEARAQQLFYTFRCVVCQGQSIAESDAPLAQDIRQDIRRRIEAHESNAVITDALQARFGSLILMRPPLSPGTAVLWAFPLMVFLAGLWFVWRAVRKKP